MAQSGRGLGEQRVAERLLLCRCDSKLVRTITGGAETFTSTLELKPAK
ncbi:MAG: hypothetical protein WA864_09280 [Acetobacteraceae bacterium]